MSWSSWIGRVGVLLSFLGVGQRSGVAEERVTIKNPPSLESTSTESLPLFAVRVEPLALLYGVYGAAAEIGVSRRVTLGLIGEFFSPSPNYNRVWVYEGGALSTIYLSGSRFQSGWIVQPAFDYVTVSASRIALDLRTGNYVASATGGYEWDWGGPDLILGAGISYFTSPGSSGVEPVLNLRAGWVF